MTSNKCCGRARRGYALLDALIALAILSLVTAGMIALLRQTVFSLEEMHRRDRVMREATTAMASLIVRDGSWLDEHLGDSRYEAWDLHVERQSAQVYDLTLKDTVHESVLLETATYLGATEQRHADH